MNLIRALYFLIIAVTVSKRRLRHIRLSGHHNDRAIALDPIEKHYEQKYRDCFPQPPKE